MHFFQSYCFNFFQILKNDFKNDKLLLFFILVLITIPLNHFINDFVLVLFLFKVLFSFKSTNFKVDSNLIPLVLLYFIMLISFFWSIERESTIKAFSKELSLLIIPLSIFSSKEFLIKNKKKVLKYYSYSILLLSILFLVRAFFNFIINGNLKVFLYHDLVSKDLNAIHVSVFVSIAFFYFFIKDLKKTIDYFLIIYLFVFLLLLSSKIIVFTTILLILIYFFFYSRSANKMRLRNLTFIIAIILGSLYFGKIKEKILFEFKIKADSNIGHTVINKKEVGSNIISMKEAWYNEKFNQTDYFSGTSFRVYQARLLFDFLKEDRIFWTGFGLNASYDKIEEKGIKYNVFLGNHSVEGYQKKNFHNQYVQNFAELGVIGFLILLMILFINIKNALKTKDFIHIAFAVLMISLFLTESFLWRQRGVLFFTILYCLFNSTKKEKIAIK